VLAALVSLALPAQAQARDRYALLEAGAQCPTAGVVKAAASAAGSHRTTLLPGRQVAAARARVRATRALARARRLYTRANFAGCVALLSITEQELGLNLADHRSTRQQEAHRLLARVNLWLGICQWAAGDPQTAAISFVRSSQLPGSPMPDPRQLPPAVVRAYRGAVEAPQQQVSCEVVSPLTPGMVQVNGHGPMVQGGSVLVPAGTHYVVLAPPGAGGKQSLRLQASALRCKVKVPSSGMTGARPCVSVSEAADPAFVAGITAETGAAGSLVVSLDGGRLALRLHRGQGKAVFERQLMVRVDSGESPAAVVARSVSMLLSGGAKPAAPPVVKEEGGWYTKWWVWALVGTAVVVTTTSAILASQNDRVRVVFGP